MAGKISSDRTIRRKPVDRTPRVSDGLPGPSRFHPEPLRTDTHGDQQQQEMSSVLHGSDVARLGVSAVASGVMDSLRRKSQEDMRVRALEEKVKQLELKDQQREADFGHLKAGIGMDQGDRNLMEAHTAFERAGRILAEAKLELRVATDLKNGTWEERENSRIRLHTARSTVGGGIYHTGDIKNASQHAKDERERIEKSIIEDIEKRIGKVNERRKDTIDDK